MPRGVYPRTEQHRAAMSAGHRSKPLSLETRANMSAAQHRRYKNPAEREKIGAALRGKSRDPCSSETRATISAIQRRRYENPAEREKTSAAVRTGLRNNPLAEQRILNCAVGRARWHRQHPTRWELALRQLLRKAGFKGLRYERRFGRYTVDAYVPSHQIAFEADAHWRHTAMRESGQEEARDLWLMAEHGLLAVIHLTKNDLKPFLPRKDKR